MNPAIEWQRCRPWIVAALATSPNLETIVDVERLIESGHYQVWFGMECAAITEIAQFANRKALIILHGGGNMAEGLDQLEPAMCAYALKNGCDMIMGQGRRGWERVAAKHGYRFGFITVTKDLVQ